MKLKISVSKPMIAIAAILLTSLAYGSYAYFSHWMATKRSSADLDTTNYPCKDPDKADANFIRACRLSIALDERVTGVVRYKTDPCRCLLGIWIAYRFSTDADCSIPPYAIGQIFGNDRSKAQCL